MKDNKIFIEGFYLLFFGLIALMLIRVLILNHSFESTWDISLLFLVSSLYITLRFTFTGTLHEDNYEFRFKKVLGKGIFAAVLFTVIMVLLGSWPLKTAENLLAAVIGGLVFFVLWVVFYFVSYKISRKNN